MTYLFPIPKNNELNITYLFDFDFENGKAVFIKPIKVNQAN